MQELVTNFDVVFRCESSEKLDEFLVSYDGSDGSCLHVFDLSSAEEYKKNSITLKNCRLKGKYKHLLSNSRYESFDMFRNLLDFDRNYEFFQNKYIVFCDGIQFFDDTLTTCASLINDKCLSVSPVSVGEQGEFKYVDQFNPKCFIVNKSIANKILNNFKVNNYDEFVKLASINNDSFIYSGAMVFE